MAVKEGSTVPLISVTSDDDLSGQKNDYYKALKVNDDHVSEFDDSENEKSMQPLIGSPLSKSQISVLTDIEVLDTSDDDQVLTGAVRKKPMEIGRTKTPQLYSSKVSKLQDLFKNSGGVTDVEEYFVSESASEDNEFCGNSQEDVDIISNLLLDDETVDIADRLKRSPSSAPSPCVTPTHELRIDNKRKVKKSKKTRHSIRRNFNQNSVSPRSLSPHLSDLTDTEIIYSDSDEETKYIKQRPLSPYERKRKVRNTQAEIISSPDMLDNTLSLPEPAVLHISETPPPNLLTSSNTESEDISEKEEKIMSPLRNTFCLSKVQPNVLPRKDSEVENSALTDEELYGISNESEETAEEVSVSSELHLQIVDNFCGSTAEKELNRDLLKSSECDKPNLTDTEDFEVEDDLGMVDLEIVRTDTKTAVGDTGTGSGDVINEISISHVDSKKTVNEGNSKTPGLPDENTSVGLPDAVRNLILTKEDQSGRPVSVMIPLGNLEPSGLIPPTQELDGGTSEFEDLEVSDTDDTANSYYYPRYPTPELPDLEESVVEDLEIVKTENDKLKLQKVIPEPVTDTEDLFLSVDKKPKKGKLRHKSLPVVKHSSDIVQNKTDTEEIDISDRDENEAERVLDVPASEHDPVTDIDDMYVSGDDDGGEDKQHFMSVTPDCLKDLTYDTVTTSKEDMEPFSAEARQQFLALDIPKILTTPDVQLPNSTDSEDMTTSADEDAYSRAETMTPFDMRMELEDQSSTVYMKHTNKFDLDAPEEVVHVKGAVDIRESFTDVEDLGFSEDEPPHQLNHVSVNDTANEVCVCFNSDTENRGVKVCVCVGKKHGELSLMWEDNSSTDAAGRSAQDWSKKSEKPVEEPTAATVADSQEKLEGEEGLFDIAAGFQDTPASSGTGTPAPGSLPSQKPK